MSSIELRAVSKSYGSRVALRPFSLTVDAGERVALWGRSGAGKTTALRLIAGLEAPDAGTVLLDGRVASEARRILVAPEERRIGMVFQDLALWPHLSVRGHLEFITGARRIPVGERAPRIREMLALARLTDEAELRPDQLSGGQQQRVALARALVLEPRTVLLDEPLSNLDPELRGALRAEILELHSRLGFTMLLVSHDRSEAEALSTRLVEMKGTSLVVRNE